MKRVAIATLGCKTNQFETAAMIEQFKENGYEVVKFDEVADLYVVNSCTVTARTDTETRRLIRRARRLNNDARIVATGCYAQVNPLELEAMPEVDTVLGNLEKRSIAELAESGENLVSDILDISKKEVAESLKLESFSEHTRAFLQIQNGCNAFCSYCIVPYSRGRSRSVKPSEIIEGVKKLADNGYKEIVLTGIHLGAYGLDLGSETSLLTLIESIEKNHLVERLRIGSLEPNELNKELIIKIRDSKHICHHLHLPLQSGSDTVLVRMRRHYTASYFSELVQNLHNEIPDAYIAADVIAGFPGESDEEFNQTVELIESLPLSDLHVFPYSKRNGTAAADMDGHLPPSVIRERAKLLRDIACEKKEHFMEGEKGKTLKVLVQKCDSRGLCSGISRNYAVVSFKGDISMINSEQNVKIIERVGGELWGEMVFL